MKMIASGASFHVKHPSQDANPTNLKQPIWCFVEPAAVYLWPNPVLDWVVRGRALQVEDTPIAKWPLMEHAVLFWWTFWELSCMGRQCSLHATGPCCVLWRREGSGGAVRGQNCMGRNGVGRRQEGMDHSLCMQKSHIVQIVHLWVLFLKPPRGPKPTDNEVWPPLWVLVPSCVCVEPQVRGIWGGRLRKQLDVKSLEGCSQGLRVHPRQSGRSCSCQGRFWRPLWRLLL